MPVLAILGLTSPGRDDWAHLRGLQYAKLADGIALRMVAHALAAALSIWVYFGTVTIIALVAWALALFGVLYYGVRCDKGLADADQRIMTREEFKQHCTGVALIALVWCVPIAFFTVQGSAFDMLALWSVVSALIVGSALMIAAAAGLAMIALQGGLVWAAFRIAPASAEVESLARDYMQIRIFSAPAARGPGRRTGCPPGAAETATSRTPRPRRRS